MKLVKAYHRDEIDDLVDAMARPVFVLQMAKGSVESHSEAQRRSAHTRIRNAKKDIRKALSEYSARVVFE